MLPGLNIESPFGSLDSSFLVINKYGIFRITSDMSVTKFEQYTAIGAGSEYGLGAIYSLYNEDYSATAIGYYAISAAKTLSHGVVELQSLLMY